MCEWQEVVEKEINSTKIKQTCTHKRWKVATNKFPFPSPTKKKRGRKTTYSKNQATKPTTRECRKWLPCGTHKTYLGLHKLCNITTISNIYMVEPYWMRWIHFALIYAFTSIQIQTYPKICDFPTNACLPACLGCPSLNLKYTCIWCDCMQVMYVCVDRV